MTQVTDFGMSRFVPQPASAIAASTSYAPPAAPPSSSSVFSASSPSFGSPPSADVKADGDAPDSANNPFSAPLDARGSGSSRVDPTQDNALESTAKNIAHGNIEEGPTGGGEGRGNGTTAGRKKRVGGKNNGDNWGFRGASRWGRSSWGPGTATTPARGTSAGNSSDSAAGEGEKKGELGLTTNVGTMAWAAPEMLLGGDGGRGEYTVKVGGACRVMGAWHWEGHGLSPAGKSLLFFFPNIDCFSGAICEHASMTAIPLCFYFTNYYWYERRDFV